MVWVSRKEEHAKGTRILTAAALGAMGLGFALKSITGSNDEIQIGRVFWHDARWIHAMLFGAASVLHLVVMHPSGANLPPSWVPLLGDTVFSVVYRAWTGR